jgi:hypothetical protein
VVSTLQSDVLAFYTTTTIGDYRWSYIALFSLSDREREYSVDLGPFLEGQEGLVYDYLAGQTYPLVGAQHAVPLLGGSLLAGTAGPGEYRYVVIPPRAGGLHLLGFLDKYVTVSHRQVKGITDSDKGVEIDLELPASRGGFQTRPYTFAVLGAERLEAEGQGISNLSIERRGQLAYIRFRVDSPNCRLILRD